VPDGAPTARTNGRAYAGTHWLDLMNDCWSNEYRGTALTWGRREKTNLRLASHEVWRDNMALRSGSCAELINPAPAAEGRHRRHQKWARGRINGQASVAEIQFSFSAQKHFAGVSSASKWKAPGPPDAFIGHLENGR